MFVGHRRFVVRLPDIDTETRQGASIAIAYAVRHPERLSKLVIYGGFARGRRKRGIPDQDEEADLQERAIRIGWGRENPAFRQIFTSQFMANGTPAHLKAWDDMQRLSCSAETAARIVHETHLIDVVGLLPQVRVPTLVMHAPNDARIPFEEGRLIASLIPGAEFVPLDSGGHTLVDTDPAFRRFFAELVRFADESPGLLAGCVSARSRIAQGRATLHHFVSNRRPAMIGRLRPNPRKENRHECIAHVAYSCLQRH